MARAKTPPRFRPQQVHGAYIVGWLGFPQLTPRTDASCWVGSPSSGTPYFCFRRPGHKGLHAAGDGVHVLAVWADPIDENALHGHAHAPRILAALRGEQ